MDMSHVFGSNSDNDAHVQLYVNDTMKLSGIPFSIRVIVLVSSVIPLRAYIYQHGIIHYRTDKDFSKDCSTHLDTEMLWFYIRHHYNAAAEAYVKTAIADSVFWTLDGSVSALSPNTHSPPAPCKRCYQLLAYDILLNSAQLHPVVISVHNESEVFSDCQQPRYILRKQALLNEMVDIILDKPTRTPMFSDLRPLCNEGSARWSNSNNCRHTLRERAGDLVWKPNATYCSQVVDGRTIQALHIYPGKLTPPFHPAIFKYTLQLEYEDSAVEVLAIPVYCGATVFTGYAEDATWPFNWAVGAGQATLKINGHLDKRPSFKYRISSTRKYIFKTENPSSHKVSPHDVCSLVQDCNYIFDKSQACGLGETKYRDWDEMEFAISRLPLCTTGYAPGRWLVPCGSCYDRQSCYWPRAVWQPYDCRYMDLNTKNLQTCLAGRTILFQGDSILHGIFDYMHDALKLKKGTGNAADQHIYVTTSNEGKKVAMQYTRLMAYEEDDVVDIPRYFNSEFDKLLSTAGKIENTKNTIFALGGAYWMQSAIYKWFMDRLDNAGLTNVTVVIKMDNAALHHPQIKTPTFWDPVQHLKRNLAVAHMIESEKPRSQNVKLVNPMNITIPMFQGFHEGGFCSCHFHKYHLNATYAVDGHVQKMYIKPFFHTLCLGETDRRS